MSGPKQVFVLTLTEYFGLSGNGLFVMQQPTASDQRLPRVVCLGLTAPLRKQGHSSADPYTLVCSVPNKLP